MMAELKKIETIKKQITLLESAKKIAGSKEEVNSLNIMIKSKKDELAKQHAQFGVYVAITKQ